MTHFACPYLGMEVELTDERERHIAEGHPDLLPEYREQLAETIADPDEVRRSDRFGRARLFSRWYDDVRRGNYIVVVVVSDLGSNKRHWIITAYLARKLLGGETEWKRD
jgi:hypothetical protein